MFYVAYHLHWSPEETLSLATSDRWTYIRLLTEQLEREQAAIDEAGSS